MQVEVFDDTLKGLQRRMPFRPFTVALITGDQFEVDHQNAIVVRDGTAIYVAPGGSPIIFDFEGVSHIIGDLKGEEKDGSQKP